MDFETTEATVSQIKLIINSTDDMLKYIYQTSKFAFDTGQWKRAIILFYFDEIVTTTARHTKNPIDPKKYIFHLANHYPLVYWMIKIINSFE